MAKLRNMWRIVKKWIDLRAWRRRDNAGHPQHHIYSPEVSKSPEPASVHTRLGKWTRINNKEKTQSDGTCAVVGNVPKSLCRYVLRFEKLHVCLHILRKPEDTPGWSRTPHFSVIRTKLNWGYRSTPHLIRRLGCTLRQLKPVMKLTRKLGVGYALAGKLHSAVT